MLLDAYRDGQICIQVMQGWKGAAISIKTWLNATRQGKYGWSITNDLEINRQSLNDIDHFIDHFFQWFCVSVGLDLNLPIKVDAYWHNHLTPSPKVTNYFQKYLLPEFVDAQDSLLLVLDSFNPVFGVPEIIDRLALCGKAGAINPSKGIHKARTFGCWTFQITWFSGSLMPS